MQSTSNQPNRNKNGQFKPLIRETEVGIVEFYTSEIKPSRKATAEKFGVIPACVTKVLQRNNIKMKTIVEANQVSRKYKVDFDFFKYIDSERKAYWLGVLAADGCVYKQRLVVGLSRVDREHLVLFLKDLNSTYPIIDYINNRGNECSGIDICARLAVEHLKNLGIIERKTLVLQWPVSVPAELESHFIRGYFDGDGSVWYDNVNNINFSIASTLQVVEEIQKRLMKYCSLDKTKIRFKNNAYELIYTGNLQVKRIMDYMYKDSAVWLSRKRNKFKQHFTDYDATYGDKSPYGYRKTQ